MCYDVCTLNVVINVNDVSYVKMNMLVMLNRRYWLCSVNVNFFAF